MSKEEELAELAEYYKTRKMIFKICWKYVRRYGGDIEEYISEGNAAYIRAHRTYDPNMAKFSTYLWHCVSNACSNLVKKNRTVQINTDLAHSTIEKKKPNSFLMIFQDLPEDAKIVVRLTLDTPIELANLCKGNSACNFRVALQKYLQQLGWHEYRISRAFREIRTTLG